MIRFQAVNKSYGSVTIIDIPSLHIENGLYWLKGGNGAGKSTLLKVIAGIIPFQGEIEINGTSIRKQPVEYRRLVNYVEAEPLYPPFLKGIDLIRFFKHARGGSDLQAGELQERFGVSAFASNPINTYSSGMVKKLSLVLAFIGNPSLILLDEPLVTIDKETVPVLYSLIRESVKKEINFIVASHQSLEEQLLPPIKGLGISDHVLRPE